MDCLFVLRLQKILEKELVDCLSIQKGEIQITVPFASCRIQGSRWLLTCPDFNRDHHLLTCRVTLVLCCHNDRGMLQVRVSRTIEMLLSAPTPSFWCRDKLLDKLSNVN